MVFNGLCKTFAVVSIALACFQIALAQANSIRPQTFANDWQKVPISLPREPQDQLSQKDLQDRGAYFDTIIGSSIPLDDPAAATLGRSVSGTMLPKEEFPTSSSDTVVIATFNSYTPHLSPSRRSIYTEIKLGVDTVIKPGASNVQTGQVISELVAGGTIVLPDGRNISDGIIPRQFFLLPQHRYLLFLKYEPEGRFFTLVKSWELKDHTLQPNSPEDQERAGNGTSVYSGKSESEIVSLLQSRTRQN